MVTNKVKEISFKIIHRFYLCNSLISKYIPDVTSECSFCELEIESIEHLFFLSCNSSQTDVNWSVNGIPKGIIKQSLGQVPIMVKSRLCNLHGLPPKELIEHHQEAEEMGCYFVNGIEKVIHMLIMPRRNYPIAMSRPKWKNRGYTQYDITMHCVKEEYTAINMNLHYLDNGTVMLNFIYQKELFFLPLGFALKFFVDYLFHITLIYQDLIKGHEENSFYKSCVSEMLRLVKEGCTTCDKVANYLGERFRVKMSLPEWYTHEQCANYLLDIHLKSDVEKFYLLCLMTRKLFTFAKQECMEANPDNLCQDMLRPGQLYLMFLKSVTWKKSRGLNTFQMHCMFCLGILLSHFRCVHRGAAFAKMRTTSVRRLLPKSWGFLCPVHTPDGEPCILRNHMTAHCEIVAPALPTTTLPALLCSAPSVNASQSPNTGNVSTVKHSYVFLPLLLILVHATLLQVLKVVLVPQTSKASMYLFSTPCHMMPLYVNVGISEDVIQSGVTTHQELFRHSMLSVVTELVDLAEKKGEDNLVFVVKPGDPKVMDKLDADDTFYSYINLNTGQMPCNPTIGDKFASHHWQKGILSRRLWPAEDMPFTESGMTPDILFNPHGFPSPMTIGMLIESMASKSGALHGLYQYAMPFTFSEESLALEHFGDMLRAAGYNHYCTERLSKATSHVCVWSVVAYCPLYWRNHHPTGRPHATAKLSAPCAAKATLLTRCLCCMSSATLSQSWRQMNIKIKLDVK
uniref:DNA-directed RNA polymerase n=1 Tax=Hucho hucho TaxID=62062 RepID=A0A4W5PG09_9TELE